MRLTVVSLIRTKFRYAERKEGREEGGCSDLVVEVEALGAIK